MFKNYITITLRNLLKHRFYSLINISGLTLGLSCFLMISIYVVDELSFDRFFRSSDQVYRVHLISKLTGNETKTATVGAPTGITLKNDYPEVEDFVRLRKTGNWFVKEKGTEKTFKEEKVLVADENFFDFFGVNLVYGDEETCLTKPHALVMDLTTSIKIFGNVDPVGKVLVLDNEEDYEVTAVYEDLPPNSHFHHNILLSMKTFETLYGDENSWMSTNYYTYIRVKEDVTKESMEAHLPEVVNTYIAPQIQQFLGVDITQSKNTESGITFKLMPVSDIHLYSGLIDELEANGDIKYVYIFSAVALFILTLACINFMNMSTARSANRAKEVGVRKSMGAVREQLIIQFIMESVLLTFISLLLALGCVAWLLPYFSELAVKDLNLHILFRPQYIGTIFIAVLLVGIFAGSYPAFYLSAFRPIEVLKGKIRQGLKSGSIRSSLVVFQFAISIIMMVCTAIVFDQLSFIQNKKLGFNKDQVLLVKDAWILRERADLFKDRLRESSLISAVSSANFTPVNKTFNRNLHSKDPQANTQNSVVINQAFVDPSFMDVLGFELVEGRFFDEHLASDSTACLLNEAAVKIFGYENPVNDKIYRFRSNPEKMRASGARILGVVKDFHFQSLKSEIEPLIICHRRGDSWQMDRWVLVRFEGDKYAETIDWVRSIWEDMAPGQPFAYDFLDSGFEEMYRAEKKVGQVFTLFAVLAIIIACLGLFALAAFTAEQKTKEIGIRKVLGASVFQIVYLLSLEFVKLVVIAFFIAIPIAFFSMNRWLMDFAYRTDIKVFTFIATGFLAMFIAWLTISTQSWLAARANPVKSLRSE